VGFYIAQHPTAAVKEHDGGQWPRRIPRTHNVQRESLKGDLLHVHGIAGNVEGLHIAHQSPGLRDGEFVQGRATAGAKGAKKTACLGVQPPWKLQVTTFGAHEFPYPFKRWRVQML
jgi:hypothetical protein